MDSGELIELFYNRTYEKFVNKQILDDKNYIVPRQQLTNYVHELIDIPYIDFIDYLNNKNEKIILNSKDITTQFSSFSACEIDMCNALIWANNPGCTFVEIGRLFPEKVSSRNDISYRLYGEKHVKASTQLGLTFEYYDYWYLSCIGYIYPNLTEDERIQLLARTITRNNLYRKMLLDVMDHDIYPDLYLTMFSGNSLKSRIKRVVTFFDICKEECELNNISTHRFYRRNANIDSISSLSINKEKSIYSSFFLYKLLSFEESIILFQRYEFRKDHNAFDKLVKSYLRVVLSTAKHFEGKGLEYDDLIQEGTLGLIKAIEKYDYTLGFSFGFYAKSWIKQSINQAINTQALTVQIPQNQLILYKKVRKAIEKYEQINELHPSITEIEIGEDIELENISYLDSLPNDLKNTCIPYGNLDVFEDNHNDIQKYEDTDYEKCFVRSLLSHLSEREREILIRIFGIGVREETLDSIGDTFGLSRERVRQIKENSINKLREMISTASTESIIVESLSTHDKDLKEQNMTENDAEETQTLMDVKKVFTQCRNTNDNPTETLNRKATENNKVALPSETSKDTLSKVAPLNTRIYTVVNYGGKCNIYDYKKKLVYSSTGYIKEIDKSFYRMSITFTFLSIVLLLRNNKGDFFISNKVILANQQSSLHRKLKSKEYLNLIEDIDLNKNRVKVAGCWFNERGDNVTELTEQEVNDIGRQEVAKEPIEENKNRKHDDQQFNKATMSVQEEVKKLTTLTYNGHKFRWNVGDIVKLGFVFSSSISIQGDPYFLFRRNILFVFMKLRTANKNKLDSKVYLMPTDTQKFKKDFSYKYGRRTPRILFFISDSPSVVHFLDEVRIQRIDTDFIRFESLL